VLYFVDESGIDLKEAPCSVLAGVGVPEASVWPFAQAFTELQRNLLRFAPGTPYEVKGSKLLTRRVFRQAGLVDQMSAEDRADAIDSLLARNERGANVTSHELAALAQAKLALVDKSLDLARAFELTAFASIVPKDAPQQREKSFLRKDFSYLFQRIHCHVCDGRDEHGILIFDEQDRALSQRLLDQIHKYFTETERGQQRAQRTIPMPFFVHSELTPAIQMADLMAYITNWGLRMPRMGEPARDELKPFADKVFERRYRGRSMRMNGKRASRIWGIAYIPDLRPRNERGKREPSDLDAI
jgi:hypothetical protein